MGRLPGKIMSKDVTKYRDDVITHLEYIKEKVDANHAHLKELNGRVRKNEVAISWIKGVGASITFVIGTLFTWFSIGD
jgi:hypothetical protein